MYRSLSVELTSLLAQILRKLEERGADLDRLQEMQEKDIGALIRYAPGGRVFFLSLYGVPKFYLMLFRLSL